MADTWSKINKLSFGDSASKRDRYLTKAEIRKKELDKEIASIQAAGNIQSQKLYGRAVQTQAKAHLYGEKTERAKFLMPLLLGTALLFLLVGPSLLTILQIISEFNPLLWIFAIILLIYVWRRNI